VGPYYRQPIPAPQGTIVPTWLGSLAANGATESRRLHRRFREYDPATEQFTKEDPIGLAGGANLYGYANGDPVNLTDPFGLAADTIKVDRNIEPQVTNCKGKSAECKDRLELLESSTEYWEIRKGSPGQCAPFIIGCTTHAPIRGHGTGGRITIIPGEFDKVKFFVNTVAVISHEVGHATTDKLIQCLNSGEACAIRVEQIARKQAGLPPRP